MNAPRFSARSLSFLARKERLKPLLGEFRANHLVVLTQPLALCPLVKGSTLRGEVCFFPEMSALRGQVCQIPGHGTSSHSPAEDSRVPQHQLRLPHNTSSSAANYGEEFSSSWVEGPGLYRHIERVLFLHNLMAKWTTIIHLQGMSSSIQNYAHFEARRRTKTRTGVPPLSSLEETSGLSTRPPVYTAQGNLEFV